MTETISIKIFRLTILPSRPITGNTPELRGFFAAKFNEYQLLHQHDGDKFDYRQAVVQYKIIDGVPMIIGINEGVEILNNIYSKFDEITLGDNTYKIVKTFSIKDQEFGMTKERHSYKFVTPWFALDQKGYGKYRYIKDIEEKNEFLIKRLNSDIIHMSTRLDYYVPEWIESNICVEELRRKSKKKYMTMFIGEFSANFIIPDYLGIGKSVSKGFGTVKLLRK